VLLFYQSSQNNIFVVVEKTNAAGLFIQPLLDAWARIIDFGVLECLLKLILFIFDISCTSSFIFGVGSELQLVDESVTLRSCSGKRSGGLSEFAVCRGRRNVSRGNFSADRTEVLKNCGELAQLQFSLQKVHCISKAPWTILSLFFFFFRQAWKSVPF
jgi:hypothetical protein